MKTLLAVESRIFDKRFTWETIDSKEARRTPEVLEKLHESCLIESYFTVYTAKMLDLFWDEIPATTIFTIEAFEAYTHYYSLRRYLEIVGYNPVRDEEVISLRERDRGKEYDDKIKELVNFGMTELFAADFFQQLGVQTKEPVLMQMLEKFAAEEVTHAEFAFDLLEKRLVEEPGIKDYILECASNFQHIGGYVLDKVSPAQDDNLKIITQFNQRIKQLTGESLSEYLVK